MTPKYDTILMTIKLFFHRPALQQPSLKLTHTMQDEILCLNIKGFANDFKSLTHKPSLLICKQELVLPYLQANAIT